MGSAIKNNAILARWAETLARRGPNGAIFGQDGGVERTFADIESEAGKWAQRLEKWPAGTVVAIQAGNSPPGPALVLATLRLGLIPLPLGRHMAHEERELALQTCGASALVTCEGVEPRTFGTPVPVGCDFLKLTSGTTSAPRAIRFTAAQLAADCDNICATMGIGPDDVNFGVIPFSHSYGFSNLITPLLCQGVRLAASDDRMPRAILTGLASTRATVFAGMPVFYEKLAELKDGPTLPDLRLCISAGAPLPARVGLAFTARDGLKIHTFYGSSECGGIAYDATKENEYEDCFVGQPMRHVQVTPEAGQIVIRSEAVGLGYFPEPEPETLADGRFIPRRPRAHRAPRHVPRRPRHRYHQHRRPQIEPRRSRSPSLPMPRHPPGHHLRHRLDLGQ